MAFNQPLVPVLPVARELISKTKWVSSSKSHNPNQDTIRRKGTTKLLPFVGSSRKSSSGSRTPSSTPRDLLPEEPRPPMPSIPIPPTPSDTEQSTDEHLKTRKRSRSRTRVLSLFKRRHHHESHPSRSSVDSDASVSVSYHQFARLEIVTHHLARLDGLIGARGSFYATSPTNSRGREPARKGDCP